MVQLLTKLQQKLISFHWGPNQKQVFTEIKGAFKMAPVLVYCNYEKETVLEMDASSYVSAGELS
jgi:hypothetical protein